MPINYGSLSVKDTVIETVELALDRRQNIQSPNYICSTQTPYIDHV